MSPLSQMPEEETPLIKATFPRWAENHPALVVYRRLLGELSTARYMSPSLGNAPTVPYFLIATGKAAISMAEAVVSRWGPPAEGLVVTKGGLRASLPESIAILTGGHPVPTEKSLEAGDAIVNFCRKIPPLAPVVYLLSGGSSSLVEQLIPGVPLTEIQQRTQTLLASGASIAEINAYRKSVSEIKGGKLSRHLQNREVKVYVLSDVDGDDLNVIGSGPLYPQFPHTIVANQSYAAKFVVQDLERLGLRVVIGPSLTGELTAVTSRYTSLIQTFPKESALVGTGEASLEVRGTGRGGRCQHIALLAAVQLAKISGVTLLAGSTDGSDGPTNVAGAIVDSHTLERGSGLDALEFLRNFDSSQFLAASDALIVTGETQSNINDVVIAVHL